ncbi:hypothetical protein [Thermoflexus sp.]|jgi:hypothetical protein|uniref:hypothetical protein n=1 Tax=Thermoflexus sp. TaxID=1969742 RepID=UPI002604EBAB|nr:hypothetical protein [Thermoflexus sp.]
MPPFITTHCPYCRRANDYDLAELRAEVAVYKGRVLRALPSEEFIVTCQHPDCRQRFKVSVPVASPGGKPDD